MHSRQEVHSAKAQERATTSIQFIHAKMPLQAIRTVAKPQNGVGAFILQCKKLEFKYAKPLERLWIPY